MAQLEPADLSRCLFEAMGDKQLDDIVILDLRPASVVADFFVIGTAQSTPQMRAGVEALVQAAVTEGRRPVATEGEPASGWVLVDFGDVVAHVLDRDRRGFYHLESVWSNASLVARMT